MVSITVNVLQMILMTIKFLNNLSDDLIFALTYYFFEFLQQIFNVLLQLSKFVFYGLEIPNKVSDQCFSILINTTTHFP